uniref:Aquaporin 1a (Colton blood group), tandem duplicate 2 n=1 Tax=Neolamprologus brichardi TaxID=32507 RepID=A0A3Q4GEN7_NEOBR
MTEVKSWAFWRAVAAEFVGILLFVLIGLSSIVGVSLAFALAIATLAQSLGHISGAHLNPAVTLGLLVNCQISALRCAFYILAQMLGAVAASAVVNGYKPGESLGVNALNVSVGAGFAIEFFATLQLVLCIIAVTDKRRTVTGSAPLAIGLSVGLGHLTAISFPGCGINPARSFGPALILGKMKNHWVYWLAPMCGGIAASLIYDFLLYPQTRNFSCQIGILVHGPQEEYVEINGEENNSPGPSHWPKQ